jgi:hypothetical protein
MLTLLAGGTAAAFALALPLSAAPKNTNHNTSDNETTMPCGDDNKITIRAPEKLWPPNHKYYTDIFALAEDPDGGSITLTTRGTHDQYEGDTGTEEQGAGNTADDFVENDDTATETAESTDQRFVAAEMDSGSVQTFWKARAERSGRFKPGRTYTFDATAQFTDATCTLTDTFVVPHDMRPEYR